MIYDIIIIGGGPAGYTAALYAARSGRSTLVLEKLSAGGQMATTERIDNYPGFEEGIDGFALGEKMKQSAERFGAVTRYAEVKRVELADEVKRIHTRREAFEAKAVVIATGASPRRLGLPEEESLIGRGVSYCATCDGMFYLGKTVAVVGGGNSAVAEALYLAKLAKKVCLIHRRNELRAPATALQTLTENGVELILNSRVTALKQDKLLTGLTVETAAADGTVTSRTLDCDGLFVAIGRVPETALFADQLALDESGYIIAGEDTRTSLHGVYAAGDVRKKHLRQIVTATADGATAIHSIEEDL